MKKHLILLLVLILQTGVTKAQSLEFEWAHHFGGPQGDDGQAITTDSGNNVYVTGSFSGTADFDPGTGVTNLNAGSGSNVFIQKLSPAGNLIWAKTFPFGGAAIVTSIAVDPSDNVIIGGRFAGIIVFPTVDSTSTISSQGQSDAYILKINTAGQFLWARSFGNPNDNAGDPDQINDLKTDAAGNIYSTGHFYGTADFDPGTGIANLSATGSNMDIFIQKLNPDGNFVWAKKIGSGGFDESTSLAIHQNTLLLTGWFQQTVDFNPSPSVATMLSTNGYADIFLLSLTTDSDFNLVKQFGSTYTDKGVGVTTDPNGAIYLTGIFDAAIDLDPGTGTNTITPANGTDFFILKLTPAADFSWGRTFAGTYYKHSQSLAYHPNNGIVVTGIFNDTVDFDPGSAAGNFSGQDDIFIVYLDSNGNYIWSGAYGNTGILYNDLVTGIAADNLGNVYSTGWFVETVDFDCGTGIEEHTPSGPSDIYVQKLHEDLLSVNSHSLNDFQLYPNPSSKELFISAEKLNNCRIVIYNSMGTIVLEKELSDTDKQLDIQGLSPGTYVVKLSNESGSQRQVFVKID